MFMKLVLLHATCERVQGNMCTHFLSGLEHFSYQHLHAICCTQQVHVFKAESSRKMCLLLHATCARTKHVHVRTCARVTCLHMLHSALSRVKFMCLAMGLDMNQHMYAACVVARSICTCAHCALLKSAESYKCRTQHFHVSNTTTCDVSTCAEHFILPSNSFRSRRSLPTAFELHEGATVTVTRVTIS
jgi:hypothetical protein